MSTTACLLVQNEDKNQQVFSKDKIQKSGVPLQPFIIVKQSFFDQLQIRLTKVVSSTSLSLKTRLKRFLQEKHFCKDKTMSVQQFVWLLTQFVGPYERLEVLDILFVIPFISERPQDYLLGSIELFSPVFPQIQAILKFSSLKTLNWIADDSILTLFQRLEKKGFYVMETFAFLVPLFKNISSIPLAEIVSLSETPNYKLAILELAHEAGYTFGSLQSAELFKMLKVVPNTHWIDFVGIFDEIRPRTFGQLILFFVQRKMTISMQKCFSYFFHYLSLEERQKCDPSDFLATFPKLKQKLKVLKLLCCACPLNPICKQLYKEMKKKKKVPRKKSDKPKKIL